MVSLRIGALFSTMVKATTLGGLSSFSDSTSPTWTPSKFTLPPLLRPLAEPSNTIRSGPRCWVRWIFWNPRKPINATANSINVEVPITRLLARALIGPSAGDRLVYVGCCALPSPDCKAKAGQAKGRPDHAWILDSAKGQRHPSAERCRVSYKKQQYRRTHAEITQRGCRRGLPRARLPLS